MKLDLSKWNPFKFARRHSDMTSDEVIRRGRMPQPGQQSQQGQPAAGSQQMGGGMPTAWMDRGGLPDPMRMVTEMMRDPFGGLSQLDRWFGDFSPASFQPDIDVIDDADAIRIVAELPGVDKKDVQVMIEDDYIVIGGEKKLERRAEEQGAYRVERAFGTFQRVIPLPEGVDTARAEAKFENGALTIRLPKTQAAQAQGRRLDISGPTQSTAQPGAASASGTPQQR